MLQESPPRLSSVFQGVHFHWSFCYIWHHWLPSFWEPFCLWTFSHTIISWHLLDNTFSEFRSSIPEGFSMDCRVRNPILERIGIYWPVKCSRLEKEKKQSAVDFTHGTQPAWGHFAGRNPRVKNLWPHSPPSSDCIRASSGVNQIES